MMLAQVNSSLAKNGEKVVLSGIPLIRDKNTTIACMVRDYLRIRSKIYTESLSHFWLCKFIAVVKADYTFWSVLCFGYWGWGVSQNLYRFFNMYFISLSVVINMYFISLRGLYTEPGLPESGKKCCRIVISFTRTRRIGSLNPQPFESGLQSG